MADSVRILRFLLQNQGNIKSVRLGQALEGDEGLIGPVGSENLPWRPYWLRVCKELLGSTNRDSRRRLVRMLQGTALMTLHEQRLYHGKLLRMKAEALEKFRRQARQKRMNLVFDFLEKGETVLNRADGVKIVSQQKFEDYMERFLNLQFIIYGTRRYRTIAAVENALAIMTNLWFGMGLGMFAIEWPAY